MDKISKDPGGFNASVRVDDRGIDDFKSLTSAVNLHGFGERLGRHP